MKSVEYKDFSLRFHKKNWLSDKPNQCHFELTFRCGLHCRHCFTDCYNSPVQRKKELSTQEVKILLDNVRAAGALWLCLSGGDPLVRHDFLDIYSYAKQKGFIVTLFTNGYSVTEKIGSFLKKLPPFKIEITVNAATKKLYEKIAEVPGSFEKTMRGIRLLRKLELPLIIKTLVTRDNVKTLPQIKKFVEGMGFVFTPSYEIRHRLNGDPRPTHLRISPLAYAEFLSGGKSPEKTCKPPTQASLGNRNDSLFRCGVIGGDEIKIDPYGNTFLCNFIREPSFNLLKYDIQWAYKRLLVIAREKKFTSLSRCRNCPSKTLCSWCPGKALVETGNAEKPVEYYCTVAKELGGRIPGVMEK